MFTKLAFRVPQARPMGLYRAVCYVLGKANRGHALLDKVKSYVFLGNKLKRKGLVIINHSGVLSKKEQPLSPQLYKIR